MAARKQTVEETRRRIADAALELFGQRPYDLVSLADIASAAETSLATVVRQFATKEQLLTAAIAAAQQAFDGRLAEMSADDPIASVRTAIQGYERYGDAVARLTTHEERLPMVRAMVVHGKRVHREFLERVFVATLKELPARERKVRLAQLMAVTDLQVWRLLRREHGLSRPQTEAAMIELVEALAR
jgi:AcrR family transcriptional regulator